MPNPAPAWTPFLAAARFSAEPCKETLASACENVGSTVGSSESWRNLHLPWPLRCVFEACNSPQDLVNMAAQIRVGALGDIGDWLLAEERWRQGIYVDELGKVVGSLPFGASICALTHDFCYPCVAVAS